MDLVLPCAFIMLGGNSLSTNSYSFISSFPFPLIPWTSFSFSDSELTEYCKSLSSDPAPAPPAASSPSASALFYFLTESLVESPFAPYLNLSLAVTNTLDILKIFLIGLVLGSSSFYKFLFLAFSFCFYLI